MEIPYVTSSEKEKKHIAFNDAMKQYKQELLPTYSQMTILGKKDVDITNNFIRIGIMPENSLDCTPMCDCSSVVKEVKRVGGKILIKGMPGTGKTTFVRKLMHDFCVYSNEILPVFLKASIFQEIDDFEQNKLVDIFSRFINAQLSRKDYSDALLAEDIFRKNTTCVLIDGLDEMRPEWQSLFCEKLNEFTLYYPQCLIVITTRIYGIDNKLELKRFVPYIIQELSDSDIEKYIKNNVSEEYQESSINAIKNDERLYELAKTPFMLALMCIKPSCLKEGATRKAELYKETTEYLLGEKSWERQREITPAETAFNLRKALQIIAVKFFKLDMNDQFPADEARFYIKSKLGLEMGDASLLEIIRKKSGLLHYSNGSYSFVHRSIWEYYVALGMLQEPLANLLQMANVPTWEEPIRMYVGLVDESNLRKVICGLWERNKALTLRTLHEVSIFPTELLNELYSKLSHTERINLVHSLKENVFAIPNESHRKRMLLDTVSSVISAEKDCEIVYNYINLLEEIAYPECINLVYKILDLEHAQERREKYLNGDYGFKLLLVQSGEFFQGNDTPIDEREYPAHKVQLNQFYMSKNLITNKMYYDEFPFFDLYRKNNKTYSTEPDQPVNNVNWYEAYIFARWIGCDLPTESEWEYCCRSGGIDDELFRNSNNISQYGWYGINSNNQTHSVGLKKANSFGFCDMLGNLREWCLDWHRDDYYKECVHDGIINNPKGPVNGESKVLRGGCFDWAITNLRPTYRNFNRPNVNFFGNGFRVVFHESEELA